MVTFLLILVLVAAVVGTGIMIYGLFTGCFLSMVWWLFGGLEDAATAIGSLVVAIVAGFTSE